MHTAPEKIPFPPTAYEPLKTMALELELVQVPGKHAGGKAVYLVTPGAAEKLAELDIKTELLGEHIRRAYEANDLFDLQDYSAIVDQESLNKAVIYPHYMESLDMRIMAPPLHPSQLHQSTKDFRR